MKRKNYLVYVDGKPYSTLKGACEKNNLSYGAVLMHFRRSGESMFQFNQKHIKIIEG
jgi:hypothetical protein